MPTHSLLPYLDSPDGPDKDIPICNNASILGLGSSATPHTTFAEKAALQSGGCESLSCMFCDQTFIHQDELGPHVLAQHPTTFFEPTVLKVEAEFRIPGERPQLKPSNPPLEKEEVHSCIVCGQVAQDLSELEAHMRKHKDYFTYCCNLCGRRFREPWFLKNHMKMHVKPGAKSKALQDPEPPVTVNDVIQEPASEPVVTLYKMCMVCGFFFPDHKSLADHSKVHNREVEPGKNEDKEKMDGSAESFDKQESFLHHLKLQPAPTGKSLNNVRLSKWIPQLDPFNTYQAWQLATRGKIAVGPNNAKDISQDVSTDNEECGSDKEELNNIWPEGQGDKNLREFLGRELRPQQQAVTESTNAPKRSLMQKVKERPTTCEECQRTFRTYHQLVLHSRVHKRERGGEESPTSVDVKLSRMDSLDRAEEGSEEGIEEILISGEDGFDRSKVRSKECSYCGKSFRSSYYLTVHMRTHTGEKPYKCVYCDYAAAQKTSLKYHLDRRHKDQPFVEIPSRPVPSAPSSDENKHGNDTENLVPNVSKLWCPKDTMCMNGKPEDKVDRPDGKAFVQVNAVCNKLIAKSAYSLTDDVAINCPGPVNLKVENEDMTDGNHEVPLNLSLKVSVSIPAIADPKYALNPISCSFCAYKTIYPEVLIMHKKLTHKDKSDVTKKNGLGDNRKQKRYTGCPPALDGKDVAPILMTDRRHPRRTKSPPPQPTIPKEPMPVNPPRGPKWSTFHVPRQDGPEAQHYRQNVDSHCSQESSRHTELIRKNDSGKYAVERKGPLNRSAIGDMSYPVRSSAIWHSDAARLCLSSQFASLPPMDFGEPSGKRLKFSVPSSREAESGETPTFRGPVDGPNMLLLTGRTVQTASQGPGPATPSETLGQIKCTSASLGGGLDSDWSMMNLLRSCTPSDLASLYHSTPTNPSHGGLANPRAGGRTVLYQHLPTLPSLQRRDPSGSFQSQRYGTTDKSS